MRTKAFPKRLYILALAVLLPLPVLADNCGNLVDCFGMLKAALAAAGGLALFGALVSMGLDFIPGIGTVKGGIEAITGRDLITGQELSWWERALGVVPFASGLANAAAAARFADNISDVARAADRVADAGRAADRLSDATRAIDHTTDAMRAADRIADAGRAGRNLPEAGSGLRKFTDKLADFKKAVKEKLAEAKCKYIGEPVDVASGALIAKSTDFELPGPVPLAWQRTWHSDSNYQGPLGHGWHHRYDMAVWNDDTVNSTVVRLGDGREIHFAKLGPDERTFHRAERLELFYTDDVYILWNIEERLWYYFGSALVSGRFLLTRIENSNRYGIELAYDDTGTLVNITDSAGRMIGLQYNEQKQIRAILLPHPDKSKERFTAVSYGYDPGTGDMLSTTDAMDALNRYEYSNHLLVKRTLPNGLQFFFRYDAEATGARCIKTWGDDDYLLYSLEYSEGSTRVTNSLGAVSVFTHAGGLVTGITDSRGGMRSYQYNAFGELVAETDPNHNQTGFSYDERGNKTAERYPDGAVLSLGYADDLPVKTVDPGGNTWSWRYDEAGNLIERVLPEDIRIRYAYTSGLLHRITDGEGQVSEFEYDGQLNIKKLSPPDGAVCSWIYDNLGRNTKYTDANGNEKWTRYDLKGRVVQVNEPDGNLRQIAYDGLDNIISVKDRQREVRQEFVQADHLAARYEDDSVVRFRYDTEGRLLEITNESGDQHIISRDSEGDIIAETGFDSLQRRFNRDPGGRITQTFQPGDKPVSYNYDPLDRITRILYADGEELAYSYDKRGLLTSAVNAAATVTLAYDALGRKISETQGAHSVQSVYNKVSDRTRVNSSLGADILQQYSSTGLVEKITAPGWQASLEYDLLGMELKRQLPGELSHEWKRDNSGSPLLQKLLVQGKEKRTRQYRWQVNNRLEEIRDSLSGLVSFGYDTKGNLNHAVYGNTADRWRMADNTNNYYKNPDRKDRNYGKAGQLLQSEKFMYRYDETGNLVEKRSREGAIWSYRWYDSGMLAEVTSPDGRSTRFQYDALGRRTAKISSAKTTRWVWDGDIPLHEFSGFSLQNGAVDDLITWIFKEDSLIPSAKLKGKETFSVISDHAGVPFEMYDSSGGLTWSHETDLYGGLIRGEGAATDCPFRYQGQYYDEETGLCYNRFRYYDPESGIYISQDPIGINGGITLYSYVMDPNSWIDPLGLHSGAGRDHITYRGVKNGKPYTGYASAPSSLGLTPEQILSRRYGGDFSAFGGQQPGVVYHGSGVEGKQTARGLEQHYFNEDVKKFGRENVANRQNPVGELNPSKKKYENAAKKYLAKCK